MFTLSFSRRPITMSKTRMMGWILEMLRCDFPAWRP